MFYPRYNNENESHFRLSNACYYRALRSIKGEGCSKRASCFSDHEDNHCLVFAMSCYDLRRRKFGKPKTLLRHFTLNYHFRQANILSIATICSTDMPACSLLALLTSGITLSALKRNAFPPLTFQSLTLSS